jgi:ABC-type glycerol-3-phosphate transport system substrate-binding protein
MKLRPFELTLVVVFIVLMLLSLLFISTYKAKKDTTTQIGTVVIWGTLPKDGMSSTLSALGENNPAYRAVSYKQISDESFDSDLVNAIADGTGPDIIILPHEKLVTLRNKVAPVSFEAMPLRDIQSSYVDGTGIFALSDGLYAFPLMVDPLMLYWNKNILASKNFLSAPATWESLVNDYLPNLVERNADRSVTRSAVALGEYQNITNAFPIISALLLQAGSQGVVNTSQSLYQIRLNQAPDNLVKPLEVVADFYTRFSKPSNSLYSWNRSFSNDKDRFLSEDLAMYFGMASEGHGIEKLNPNLSFDVAELPQGASATIHRTYGRFYGLALVKASKNPAGAGIVMRDLTSKDTSIKIATAYGMVPVLRSAVSAGSNDTYGRLAYKSAGVAFGWLSPKQSVVDDIFTTMTQDLNENRHDLGAAVSDVLGRLKLEYNN